MKYDYVTPRIDDDKIMLTLGNRDPRKDESF